MPSSRLRALNSRSCGVGQRGHDQQDQVRAVGAGFPDLVLIEREVLAEQRDVHGGADGVEVRERAAEAALLGEHADDGGAAVGVLLRPARPGQRCSRGRPWTGCGA